MEDIPFLSFLSTDPLCDPPWVPLFRLPPWFLFPQDLCTPLNPQSPPFYRLCLCLSQQVTTCFLCSPVSSMASFTYQPWLPILFAVSMKLFPSQQEVPLRPCNALLFLNHQEKKSKLKREGLHTYKTNYVGLVHFLSKNQLNRPYLHPSVRPNLVNFTRLAIGWGDACQAARGVILGIIPLVTGALDDPLLDVDTPDGSSTKPHYPIMLVEQLLYTWMLLLRYCLKWSSLGGGRHKYYSHLGGSHGNKIEKNKEKNIIKFFKICFLTFSSKRNIMTIFKPLFISRVDINIFC